MSPVIFDLACLSFSGNTIRLFVPFSWSVPWHSDVYLWCEPALGNLSSTCLGKQSFIIRFRMGQRGKCELVLMDTIQQNSSFCWWKISCTTLRIAYHRCHPSKWLNLWQLGGTELPPYADALRDETGLPVFDAITNADFFISSRRVPLKQHDVAGHRAWLMNILILFVFLSPVHKVSGLSAQDMCSVVAAISIWPCHMADTKDNPRFGFNQWQLGWDGLQDRMELTWSLWIR